MGDVHFFRYTNLPSLIHILRNRQLTLLNPMSWDDKNDSSFLSFYRERCHLKSALALCFTRASETYHHWRIFAPSPSGVRITFNENILRNCISGIAGLQLTDVEYVKIEDIRKAVLKANQLPFRKRYPYHQESEIRMLWQSSTEERDAFPVPIDLAAIKQVTLSPWLNPSLVDSVKATLKSIKDCDDLRVNHTTLISNAEWLKHGAAAT